MTWSAPSSSPSASGSSAERAAPSSGAVAGRGGSAGLGSCHACRRARRDVPDRQPGHGRPHGGEDDGGPSTARTDRLRRRRAPHTVLPGSQVLRFMIPALRPGRPGARPGVRRTASEKLMTKLSQPHGAGRCCPSRRTATTAGGRRGRHHPGGRRGDGADAQPGRRRRRRGRRVLGAVTVSRLFEDLLPERPDASTTGPGAGRVRRGLRPDRHRADPPGRGCPRRRRGDGACSGVVDAPGRVLQRATPGSTGTSSSCCSG